jgi:hypothetical protein
VPNAELLAVLASVARVLRPGGLFFLGVYGGSETTDEARLPLTTTFPLGSLF